MNNLRQDEYENALVERGAKKIGSGLYSNVYSLPNIPDKVIKVGEMDDWPSYIKWATENGHAGKFAPNVFSLKFKSHERGNYYVALMERLVATIRDIKYPYDDSGNSLAPVSPGQLADYYNALEWNNNSCEATDLCAYVKELRKLRLGSDIHDGNVMLRSDGSVVVIDPVSGRLSSEQFRIKRGQLL